jgi:hypothetical protein
MSGIKKSEPKITPTVKHKVMRVSEDGLLKYPKLNHWGDTTEHEEFDTVDEAVEYVTKHVIHGAVIIPCVTFSYKY